MFTKEKFGDLIQGFWGTRKFVFTVTTKPCSNIDFYLFFLYYYILR